MTIAAGDAHEYPIYGGRYRAYFPILDNTGSLVTGTAGKDTEVSIDGGTFADCTNEATEVATASGMYFIDLTATEMTGKCILVISKTTTTDAKTTVLSLNPKRMPVLRSGTSQGVGGVGSPDLQAVQILLDSGASAKDSAYVGLYIQCTNNTPANVQGQTRKIIAYTGSTKIATVESAWGTNPSSSTTFSLLVPDVMTAAGWLMKELVDPNTDGVPAVDTVRVGGTLQTAGDVGAKAALIPGTQDGKTFAEHILLQSSVLLAKASGLATTTAVFRALDDSQDRVTATVDSSGNRTAVTYDTTSP